MAKKTRTAITSEITTTLADNNAGNITPAVLRTVAQDITDTFEILLTPTATKTANFTAVPGELITVDLSAGSLTGTLPTTPEDGTKVMVKITSLGTGNTLSLNAGGSAVFNKAGGVAALTASVLFQTIIVQYQATGAIWIVRVDYVPVSYINRDKPRFEIDSDFIVTVGEKRTTVVATSSYTITGWILTANVASTASIDIWKANGTRPTVANSITASAKPSLSNSTYASSSTLTGWTVAVSAGDVFVINVLSNDNALNLILTLITQ